MTRAVPFEWTRARLARARKLYLDEGLRPVDVAARMGEGLSGRQVQAKAAKLGWPRLRAGYRYFRWTRARDAELSRLYLDCGLGPKAIARRIGAGVTADAVQRRIIARGMAGELSAAERRTRRLDALDHARAAMQRVRASRGDFVWTAAVKAELRRLYVEADTPPGRIAAMFRVDVRAVRRQIRDAGLPAVRAALGKGRMRVRRLVDVVGPGVTRLAAGHAAGVSGWETALHAAGPPDSAAKRQARARGQAASLRTREMRVTAEGRERRLDGPARQAVLA